MKKVNKVTVKSKVQKVIETGGTYFLKKSGVNRKGMNVASRPPTIKPAQFGEDDVLVGELVSVRRIEGSKKSDGKPWCTLHIRPEGDKVGVEVTATAIIKSALQIDIEDVSACPYIGHLVSIELGSPTRLPSGKGSDSWNFIVEVSENPVKV